MSEGVTMLETREQIAKFIGRHPNTLDSWIKTEGFPACKTPKGTYITTETLIEKWILERGRIQRENRTS